MNGFADHFFNPDLLNAISDAVLILDSRGRIQRVNPAFSKITGYSEEELQGEPASFLSAEQEELGQLEASLSRQLETTGQWQGTLWGRRKNGDVTLFKAHLRRLPARDSVPDAMIILAQDLSTRLAPAHAQEKHLTEILLKDVLTGVGNRQLLVARLDQQLSLPLVNDEKVGLLLVDVGSLKQVNRRLGPTAGDQLLLEQAKRLQQLVTDTGTLVRLYAAVFALVLHQPVRQLDLLRLAKKSLKALQKPLQVGEEVLAKPSVGIAFYPDHARNQVDLIQAAEVALLKAKQAGRRRVSVYDSDTNASLQRQLRIENDLQLLLSGSPESQLQIYYQPKVSLPDQHLCGCEALLRWQHPELGWISPADFIPLAEQSGLSVHLDRWVIRQVLKQQRDRQLLGARPFQVSVNLSANQLDQKDFASWLDKEVKTQLLTPDQLMLEITETAMIKSDATALRLVNQLQQAGFQLSMDDFGTGYSSLAYLAKLPLDELKVDRSFLLKIESSLKVRRLLETLVQMAANLDMDLVVEGVENASQEKLLEQMGSMKVQGYHYYRPMPAEIFDRDILPKLA